MKVFTVHILHVFNSTRMTGGYRISCIFKTRNQTDVSVELQIRAGLYPGKGELGTFRTEGWADTTFSLNTAVGYLTAEPK